MRIKRYFGFSLILFIMIFSISFASADEISDIDSNDLSLSVSADVDINENLNDESLNSVDDTVSDGTLRMIYQIVMKLKVMKD